MSFLKLAKNLAVAATAIAGLSACNDFEGTLKVNENLTLNKDKKTVTIPVGSYTTELDVDSKKVKVKVEVNDKTQKFEFAVPKDALKDNSFNIPASQTGQNYGLQGTRLVDEEMTPIRQDWESCQYEDYYTRCVTDAQGRTRCWRERVVRWGQRWVEYQDRITIYTVNAHLVNSAGQSSAQFDGEMSTSERLYRNMGYCR